MSRLKHIAIIPDGNRRWAKKRGLPSLIGHQRGADNFEKLFERAVEMKIPYFSFWGSSYDNITKRSKHEVKYLFDIFEKQFKKLLNDKRTYKEGIKVNVIGRWEEVFPDSLNKVIKEVIKKTKNHKKIALTFFMAYNGTDEMIDCVKKISSSKTKIITEETIKNNLWTKNLPPVDFLIRTGIEGDPHNSAGFMMWDVAYSQLYFTKKYFPEFSVKEFEVSVNNFENREKRRGK